MKILKKVKYGLTMMGTTFLMLPTEIFAAKEPEVVSLYAVPKEEPTTEFSYGELFLKILSFVIIPLVLLIGAIVFYKKSKMKTLTKILIILVVAIIATFSIIYVANNFLY